MGVSLTDNTGTLKNKDAQIALSVSCQEASGPSRESFVRGCFSFVSILLDLIMLLIRTMQDILVLLSF